MLTSRFGAIPSRAPPPSRSLGLRRRPGRRATDDHLRWPCGLGHPRIIRRPGNRGLAAARAEARRIARARLAASSEEEARARACGSPTRAGSRPAPRRSGPAARTGRSCWRSRRSIGGDTLEARGSLLDVLLTRPSVTAFYHRPKGLVLSVAFSPDGKTLAAGCSGGPQGGLVLVGVPSRSTETPLPALGGGARAVAFSPDGKTLAAGAGRGVVLWDVERRARLGERPLDFPGNSVSSVAFSPDGKTLAAGGWSRVVLWDVARCAAGRAATAHGPRIPCLQPRVQPRRSDPGHRQRRAHLPSGTRRAGSRSPIRSATWIRRSNRGLQPRRKDPGGWPRGGRRRCLCRGGPVDMEGRHRLFEQPLAVAGDRVTSVVYGKRTLAAVVDDRVVLWDLTRRPPLADRPLVIAGASITDLALSPDGERLAASYRRRDGGAVIWDLEARSPLEDRPLLINADVFDVAFSPDGSTIAAAYDLGSRGGVALWDARRRTRLADKPLEIAEGSPIGVAYSRDGMALAAGFIRTDLKGGVILWDARRHTRLTDRPMAVAGGGNVFGVAFSPDGSTIAGDFAATRSLAGS